MTRVVFMYIATRQSRTSKLFESGEFHVDESTCSDRVVVNAVNFRDATSRILVATSRILVAFCLYFFPQKWRHESHSLRARYPDVMCDFDDDVALLPRCSPRKSINTAVKLWLTLNEPMAQSEQGYCGLGGEHAPGGFQEHCAWTQYLAGHHMLLAHAHAYRAYHGLFPDSAGKIGIANSAAWIEPESDKEAAFADEVRQWSTVWFTHPLFEEVIWSFFVLLQRLPQSALSTQWIRGDYPPAMRATVDRKSKEEGRASSRLPYFNEYERQMLIGVSYNSAFEWRGIKFKTGTASRPKRCIVVIKAW
ncbi:hypothetical protein Y032_0373g189 [Ancylostoma ceylanicum]|nr:hypothetical protein Y032_0373g189 [Ancylostoma ceylanicum]